jgi:imidazolonepropionase-like amidohydrolase
LAFVGVDVVDVVDGGILESHTVLVEGDRITAVGPEGEVAVPEAARVIEARGRYLMPGLWDMHVHTGGFGDAITRNVLFPMFLAAGITGYREMSGDSLLLQLREETSSGGSVGPRIVVGQLVDAPFGGFGMPFIAAATAQEGAAAADAVAAAGFDFAKTYTLLPAEAYRGLHQRAAEIGLEVSGHVPIEVGLEEALELGHRTVEHLIGLELACTTPGGDLRQGFVRELDDMAASPPAQSDMSALFGRSEWEPLESLDPVRCADLYRRLGASGAWAVPTLIRQQVVSYRFDSPLLADSLSRAVAGLIGVESMWNWDPERRLLPLYERRLASIATSAEAGVGLLAGSDLWPGLPLHHELELLVDGGLSPLDALRSATLNPARYLSRTDDLGSVEPGKLADVVLLAANPLVDIRNTRTVTGVMIAGAYLDEEALAQAQAQIRFAILFAGDGGG